MSLLCLLIKNFEATEYNNINTILIAYFRQATNKSINMQQKIVVYMRLVDYFLLTDIIYLLLSLSPFSKASLIISKLLSQVSAINSFSVAVVVFFLITVLRDIGALEWD